jgi:hypothetical protein
VITDRKCRCNRQDSISDVDSDFGTVLEYEGCVLDGEVDMHGRKNATPRNQYWFDCWARLSNIARGRIDCAD